jgi:hypothetical protein
MGAMQLGERELRVDSVCYVRFTLADKYYNLHGMGGFCGKIEATKEAHFSASQKSGQMADLA